MRLFELRRAFVLVTVTAAFADAGTGKNATSQMQSRAVDNENVSFKKNYWTKGKVTSWSFPVLPTSMMTVKPTAEKAAATVRSERTSSPHAFSVGSSGAAFEKESNSVRLPETTKYFVPSSNYYQELPSAITNIANFENARVRDYTNEYYTQPVKSMVTAPENGPRVVDIVMHHTYRTPRRAKQPTNGASSDPYYAQESTRNSYYYAPTTKKKDKFDNLGEKNRRHDYDYESHEVDSLHSDRRDDHWDHDWDYDHHKYYDHKYHHKKDYDYLLPLLLLILAPLAVSSFLMPVTATLMTNSMYVAGAQGAIYQGRKKRSTDAQEEHRSLLIELANLLEEAVAKFETKDTAFRHQANKQKLKAR